MHGGLRVAVVPKRERGPLGRTLQVRVDAETARRLDAVVQDTGHTHSEVIRLLLLAGLDLHESDKKGKK